MPAVSAGLLLFRWAAEPESGERRLEVLLVHPGGPYWAKKDKGAWSIPKGEAEPHELGPGSGTVTAAKLRNRAAGVDLLAVARREVREETGLEPDGPFLPLGGVKTHHHKLIFAWAAEQDCDPGGLVSTTFAMEWPPRSGKTAEFPEVDRAAWFGLAAAREAIVPAQRRFLDDLQVVAGSAPKRSPACTPDVHSARASPAEAAYATKGGSMAPRQLSLASFGGDVAGGWCHFIAASAQGGCMRVLGGSLGMGGEPYPDMNQGFVFGPDGAGEAIEQFAACLNDRLLPGTLLALSTVAGEAAAAAAALDLPEEQAMALMCVHASDAVHFEGRHQVERVRDRRGLEEAAEVLADAYELPLEWCANMMGERFLELEAADLFLARHGDRAVAAVGSARVADTVTLCAVGTRLSHRHRGAASEALSAAVDYHVSEGAHLFGLVSVPGAEPLYAGLGFVTIDHLRGWLVPAP